MRDGNHVGDDVGIGWIRNARFEDANHSGHPVAKAAQANGFANHLGIFLHHGGPEAVGENHNALRRGSIVLRANQAPEHGVQPHHVEVAAVHHAALNFARLAQPDHREADDGEIAELLHRVDARFDVLDFGDGERDVVVAQPRRALPDVDQAVLVAIHQRLQKDAANERENGGIGADPESERQDDDCRHALRAHQRMECDSQIAKK